VAVLADTSSRFYRSLETSISAKLLQNWGTNKLCLKYYTLGVYSRKSSGKQIRLEVNSEKTMYMLMSRSQKIGQKQSTKIANRFFEDVRKFKYLGKN
jgi:hypothetical protein